MSTLVDYQTLLNTSSQPNLSSPPSLGLCLVTGAAGFVGRNIVRTLLAQGCKVRALINQTPLTLTHPNLDIIQGSITDADAMKHACQGVETVFHTAAIIALLGGPFVSTRYYQRAYNTNVNGTINLLNAAVESHVRRFIHTSSVDVCFNYTHQETIAADAPYVENPRSVYQQTKILAEKAVLAHNGKNGMYTCAIRPGGIFGAEENEVIDRFLEQLLAGRFVMRIGKGDAKMDTSFIDNLVHGELLAALHLCDNGIANGKAYFINDNEPMNAFTFFKPLIEGLSYKVPRLYLPGSFLMPFVKLFECIVLTGKFNEPEVTPHAIYKVSMSHFSGIERAQDEIGYEPLTSVQDAMQKTLAYARQKSQALTTISTSK